jgi:hypothetical protein
MIAIPQELTSGTCARMERRRRNVMCVIAHCFPRCDRTDHLCRSSSVLPDSVLLVLTLGLFYWAQFKFDWRLLFHLCARFGHGSRLNERQFYLPALFATDAVRCGPLLGPQVRSAQMPRRRGRRAQTMADQHFDPAWVEAWHFRWDVDAACFVRNVWSRREMERPANPTSHCAPGRALSFLISEDRRVGFFPDSLRYSRCFGNPS